MPRHLVWEAWTKPEHLKVWFCPEPWSVSDCEIDLRPGGVFPRPCDPQREMSSPTLAATLKLNRLNGSYGLPFCTLAIGQPPEGDLPFTAIIALESVGTGTRYVATALHRDESGSEKHKALGFYEGWGKALDQLVAHVKSTMQKQ